MSRVVLRGSLVLAIVLIFTLSATAQHTMDPYNAVDNMLIELGAAIEGNNEIEWLSDQERTQEIVAVLFQVLEDLGAVEYFIAMEEGEWGDVEKDAAGAYMDIYNGVLRSSYELFADVLLPKACVNADFAPIVNTSVFSSGLLQEIAIFGETMTSVPRSDSAKKTREELEKSIKGTLQDVANQATKKIGAIKIKVPKIWIPWPISRYIGGQTILTLDIKTLIDRAFGVANEVLAFIRGGGKK